MESGILKEQLGKFVINYNSLLISLATLGDTYEERLGERTNCRMKISEKEADVERIKGTIAAAISSAIDDEGKKKYTNDTLRNAELSRQLSKNEEFTEQARILSKLRETLSLVENDVSAIELKCRNYRVILDKRPSIAEDILREHIEGQL